jgi:fatty acid desaturase
VPASDRAYADLRRRVVEAGLLERAYLYYGWRTAVSCVLLAAGIALTFTGAHVPGALVIAFGSIQVALIGHDAGHLGVFASHRRNTALGSLCWTLVLGVSFFYWDERHTRHHTSTNDADADPDLQWSFGPALTPFLAFTFRIEGWRFALTRLRGPRRTIELALLSISMLAWLWPATVQGWSWLVALVASQLLASLYLAAIVATNHIGMPIWAGRPDMSFLERQLSSSRNVLPHPIVDFVFGGLNYQIEHHLFPSMPRTHFSAARALVKPFCAANQLPYTECGVVEVYREVLAAAPRVGRPRTA